MNGKTKLHSKSSLTKRFKKVGKKLKHWHAYTSHLAYSKTPKQKRHLRKSSLLDKSDWQRLKKIITKREEVSGQTSGAYDGASQDVGRSGTTMHGGTYEAGHGGEYSSEKTEYNA
ncbi:23401_t:CDS:2, partial [Racocetra persica]